MGDPWAQLDLAQCYAKGNIKYGVVLNLEANLKEGMTEEEVTEMLTKLSELKP